jgi:ABC-2 type transport system permease protein
MNRTWLIARREFAAYAKTVGFWLSLLAFPVFGLLGGGLSFMAASSEPVRQVVLVEEGPRAQGLAGFVREALASEAGRNAEQAGEAMKAAQASTGVAATPEATAAATEAMARPSMRLLDAPADLTAAAPGEAREAVIRRYLGDETPKDQRPTAIVLLSRTAEGRPTARVWSASAIDGSVARFIGEAMKSVNRREVFQQAGIDPAVVRATDAFDPEVAVFSPRSVSGGEVSFKDKIPSLIGLGAGFILWSLVLTGASILLNSVMEEKSNKILEVLLSSASATEILAGKVLGVALLTLTVLLAWGGLGAVGLIVAAPDRAAEVGAALLQGGLIFYFLAYMVGGYLMYAVLFAAIGAFCETPRDAQTLMGPIMMVLVVPIIVMQMALRTPDAPLVQILSWVPFFTPFLMSARAPSDPPMLEVIGTMVGMFAFAALMVWVAGRAFRAGALSDVKLSWKSFAGAIRGGGQ